MTNRMKGLLAAMAVTVLSGCQSYSPAPTPAEQALAQDVADARATRAKRVRTVQDFMNDNPALSAVDMRPLSADRRMFVFESAPQIVTSSLPSYTPPPRQYNNATLGAAFNNANAIVGGVPAVSRSTVLVCRVFLNAKLTGAGSTPSDWTVEDFTTSGNCA